MIPRIGPRCGGVCLRGPEEENEADSTSTISRTRASRAGEATPCRGCAGPWAYRTSHCQRRPVNVYGGGLHAIPDRATRPSTDGMQPGEDVTVVCFVVVRTGVCEQIGIDRRLQHIYAL